MQRIHGNGCRVTSDGYVLVGRLEKFYEKRETFEFFQEYEKKQEKLLNDAIKQGYDPNLTIENSQVKNNYYTGDVYSVQYDGLSVKVTNKSTNKTHTLNFSNLLANVSDEEKISFMKYIQTLPGEVLEDMSIELDNLQGVLGQNMNIRPENPDFVAGGYYSGQDDNIVTSPEHIVHELGHAIAYHGKANHNMSVISHDVEVLSSFEKELKAYKEAGNVQYDYADESTWKKDCSNYATTNIDEMFAESYKLMMTGDCYSKNTITKYFPKTFALIQDRIAKYRQGNELARHSTEQREIKNKLQNYFA